MLTSEGKNHIRRFLAGYSPAIARSISFGIGTRAESLSDIALHMETAKAPISLTFYDFVNNKLVYKASVPDEYIGKIYEVGLYSLEADPAAGGFDSRTLTTFDSATEDWINPSNQLPAVYATQFTRVGIDSMLMAPSASNSLTYALQNIGLDLGGYSAADSFTFAFSVGNSNTASIRWRFLTDSSNYYDFSVSAQTSGYKIVEFTKASAVVTGAPNWGAITEIQITTTSTSGGASSVEFDSIRIEDKDSASLDYILVARKVLPSSITKVSGQALDIEFTLDVTI